MEACGKLQACLISLSHPERSELRRVDYVGTEYTGTGEYPTRSTLCGHALRTGAGIAGVRMA